MDKSLTTTRTGEVRFCTRNFCFVADGENGRVLAFAANMLLFATALLTFAQAVSLVAKVLK